LVFCTLTAPALNQFVAHIYRVSQTILKCCFLLLNLFTVHKIKTFVKYNLFLNKRGMFQNNKLEGKEINK
jgi:hypothetical protein